MKPIPILDFFGSPLIAALFAILLFLQWRFPLRRQHFGMMRRIARNLLFSAPSHVVLRLAALPVPLAMAAWAEGRQIGLLHWLALPAWANASATFLLMDYAYWWWHWANHMVPFFWRFHNVHHTDLEMDASTASRFHFGEMLLSTAFLSLAVIGFGLRPNFFLAFFIAFECATLFHHSNWRLPIWFERFLNHVLVTPRMHGIHHSIVQRETNSNWGTIFCWWDKFHHTLRRDVPPDEITIGVAAYREEEELTIGRLLLLPFRAQRPWRLPSGERPERAPQSATELAE